MFGQIDRTLLHKILEEAGMPQAVLRPYKNFLEELEVYNTVAGGLGQPYTRPTSIPQGDPMSMMIQMQRCAVKPRILADELHLFCVGEYHLRNFEIRFQ